MTRLMNPHFIWKLIFRQFSIIIMSTYFSQLILLQSSSMKIKMRKNENEQKFRNIHIILNPRIPNFFIQWVELFEEAPKAWSIFSSSFSLFKSIFKAETRLVSLWFCCFLISSFSFFCSFCFTKLSNSSWKE